MTPSAWTRARALALAPALALTPAPAPAQAPTLAAANETMFRELASVHGYTDTQMQALRAVFARARFAGQGNAAVSRHPLTSAECRARLAEQGVSYENPTFAAICGGPFLAPLYDPERERPEQARVCIDQFEFPDIPCALPVVWIRAREAAEACWAVGKRLCDAHEWEGACDGRLLPPDYRFELARGVPPGVAVERMRAAHNRAFQDRKRWAYGPAYRSGACATGGVKSPGCDGGGWNRCGSNTYPAGAYPGCTSALQVFDLHGNAAEHMNLPLAEDEMASCGSRKLGVTEMKGSWFVFDRIRAHEDWCRWRAPYWHGSRVMDPGSHHNYHLGFRCCRDLPAK